MTNDRIHIIYKKIQEHPASPYAVLAAITLLAAALRFYKLGEWSFWIDEIYTIIRAVEHFSTLERILSNLPPTRNWVPISFILTGQLFSFLEINEWSARLVSVVIGIITIPILYFPTRKIFGNQITLIALLLLAVAPWHIYWSQNARFYTSVMLLSTLSLFAFYHGIEKNRPVYLLLFYVLFYLASSERIFAFFIIPIVICYLFILWIRPMGKPRALLKKIAYLLFLPLLLFALLEIIRWASGGSPITIAFLDGFFDQVNTTPIRLSLSIIYRIGVPIFSLGFFCGLYILIRSQRATLFVVIGAALPILLLLLLSIFFFAVDRYIFITLFLWLILAAIAINKLFQHANGFAKLLPLGVLSIILITSLSEMVLYYQFQNGNRPKWKEAYAFVEENYLEGDIIYTTRIEVGDYYLPKAEEYDVNSFDPTPLINRKNSNIWFVIDENTGWVKPEISSWIQKNCLLSRSEEVFLPGKSMSIRIYRCSNLDPVSYRQFWVGMRAQHVPDTLHFVMQEYEHKAQQKKAG
jgi:mannosyltransferase